MAQHSLTLLAESPEEVVVYKPAGLHVHHSRLAPAEDSLQRLLRDQLGRRVWPVHRLDRATAGLLLLALSAERASCLQQAFATHQMEKHYLAVIRGWPQASQGCCERPLKDIDEHAHTVMQTATTKWRLLATSELPHALGPHHSVRYSLVLLQPASGRRHQLRRHMAGMNHPILGDRDHGDNKHNRLVNEHYAWRRLALVAIGLDLPEDLGASQYRTLPDAGFLHLLEQLRLSEGLQTLFREQILHPQLPEIARGAVPRMGTRKRQGASHFPDSRSCPLCQRITASRHCEQRGKCWWECDTCGLIFLDPALRPDPLSESERYRLHHNHSSDAGYRRFHGPLLDAVVPLLPEANRKPRILDYGSGADSALLAMLHERGFQAEAYDPVFHPRPELLTQKWELILCSEVAEHFHETASEFSRLRSMLVPGGILALQTQLYTGDPPFADWWYKRDTTHTSFYRPRTMQWITEHFNLNLLFADSRQLTILQA